MSDRGTLLPTLDVVFRMLFGGPKGHAPLIDLLNVILRLPRRIVSLEVLDPAVSLVDVTDKAVVLDVRVKLEDGTQIDIEMQNAQLPGFKERVLLYWGRLFAAQLSRGDQYVRLRPVISVLILDYRDHDSARFHSVFQLRERHDWRVFSPSLEVHTLELPRRSEPGAGGADDPELLAWGRFLGAKTDEEAQEAAKMSPSIAYAQELLEEISRDPKAREAAREREMILAGYRVTMGAAVESVERERDAALAEKNAALAEAERARTDAEASRRFALAALRTVAEILGLPLSPERESQLEAATGAELEAMLQFVRNHRRWP